MANAKIEFSVGGITFSGEGEEKWVTEQLDKIVEKAPSLLQQSNDYKHNHVPSQIVETKHSPMAATSDLGTKPLPAFLTEKNVTTVQVKKFLATAIWLEARGKTQLTTKDITAALKTASQSRLGNPADCLNQNIKKGFCEKTGNEFFVTQEGKNSL